MLFLKIMNIAGMVFDIVGALVMFWNTPHPTREPSGGGIPHYAFGGEAREKKEKSRVQIGLIVLVAGFGLQLLSNCLQLLFE